MTDDFRLTVCGVMLDLGRDPDSKSWDRVAWHAGSVVRDRWVAEYDRRPIVRLTTKTRGNGTHDKAHYPESWRPVIVEAIEAAEILHGLLDDPRQVALFARAADGRKEGA